jgi:hypothetical protein
LELYRAHDLQTPLAFNDYGGGGQDARIQFTATPGAHYVVRANTTWPGDFGEFQLTAFATQLTGLNLPLNYRQNMNINSSSGPNPLQQPGTHYYKDYWIGSSTADCLLGITTQSEILLAHRLMIGRAQLAPRNRGQTCRLSLRQKAAPSESGTPATATRPGVAPSSSRIAR